MQIYIRCFQTTEIAINPHNTKRYLKKENYCVQIIEIMFTLKLPTFPSNLTVQLLKYEKGKIKAVCARITTMVVTLFLFPRFCLILTRFIWKYNNLTFFVPPGVILLFFKPRWGIHSRGFQFDMELFKCLFKLLLIPSKVGGNGIVEKDQLIVQYFNLIFF